MTNVTFSLPDGTIRRLRKRATDLGGRKGAISDMVDEALTRYLDDVDSARTPEVFTAVKGGVVVARAETLRALADQLNSKKVDPRSVVITSSRPLPPVGHLGLRVRER